MTRRIDIPTRFAPVSVIWRMKDDAPKVVRVFLSTPGESSTALAERLFPGSPVSVNSTLDYVRDGISRMLDGGTAVFPLYLVDLEMCSDFQRRVLELEHSIPRGRVGTYGRIASALGDKAYARAVGRALSVNPFPLLIPCHRAVRSDLSLGGYQGGEAMKRFLLESEGIEFNRSGMVKGDEYLCRECCNR